MNNISIKIKPNSKYRKMIVKQVIFAYELRKSFAGARSYINELNPNFLITTKQIRLILAENNIETKKGRVKNG